ncbi:MAG TPA: hypothetical protein VHE35_16240 [Kofleriaceae bacterium]|nr:hypothetical protein [Kofleriaceae bacterium]
MGITTSIRSFAPAMAFAVLAAGTVIGLTPAEAQVPAAPPPAQFGLHGQTILTSELALDYEHDTVKVDGEPDLSTTTYDFHVGFDRVMPASLTLGARLGFAGTSSGADDTNRGFDFGVRFGGLVPVGGARWWPTGSLVYGLTSVSDRNSSATIRTVTVVLSAPFLWQPAHHLLVGVGPTYRHDLQSKTGPDADQKGPSVSGFGVHGFLGVWF